MRTCISQHLEQLLTVGEGVRLSPRADQSDDGRGRERLVNGLPRAVTAAAAAAAAASRRNFAREAPPAPARALWPQQYPKGAREGLQRWKARPSDGAAAWPRATGERRIPQTVHERLVHSHTCGEDNLLYKRVLFWALTCGVFCLSRTLKSILEWF